MLFWLMKDFIGMLYFQIVGEMCIIKVWFHFNGLPTWTVWTSLGRTLRHIIERKHSGCGMMPTWLTTYIFNKARFPVVLETHISRVLHTALDTISMWPGQVGVAFSGSSRPAQLLPDKTKPPGMCYSALCQAWGSWEDTHDMCITKGKRYRWRWPWMCLPARMAREHHLTSCSVNTPLPHGPKGHVLGCGVEEKFSLPIRQGLCLSGPL